MCCCEEMAVVEEMEDLVFGAFRHFGVGDSGDDDGDGRSLSHRNSI